MLRDRRGQHSEILAAHSGFTRQLDREERNGRADADSDQRRVRTRARFGAVRDRHLQKTCEQTTE